ALVWAAWRGQQSEPCSVKSGTTPTSSWSSSKSTKPSDDCRGHLESIDRGKVAGPARSAYRRRLCRSSWVRRAKARLSPAWSRRPSRRPRTRVADRDSRSTLGRRRLFGGADRVTPILRLHHHALPL